MFWHRASHSLTFCLASVVVQAVARYLLWKSSTQTTSRTQGFSSVKVSEE